MSGGINECQQQWFLKCAWLLLQMWGQLVRNAREWIRMTAVYFPKELHAESLAYVQVQSCRLLTAVMQQPG